MATKVNAAGKRVPRNRTTDPAKKKAPTKKNPLKAADEPTDDTAPTSGRERQRAGLQQRTKEMAAKPRKREIRITDPARGMDHITPSEDRFATLLATGKSQREAFLEAFPASRAWKDRTRDCRASELARTDRVQARVAALTTAAADRNQLDVDEVMRQFVLRIKADPRELVGYRIGCCRYCYGKNYRYQFTEGEMESARVAHTQLRIQARAADLPDPGDFDEKGGTGYHRNKPPVKECPECFGDGVGRVQINDTNNLSEAALAIYCGVEEGKEGIKVRIGDRDSALDKVARHLGFYELDNQQQVTHSVDTNALDELYERKMAEAAAAGEEARKRRDRLGLGKGKGSGEAG